MIPISLNWIALAACAAALAFSDANAQNRAPPVRKQQEQARIEQEALFEPAARARKLTELGVWLMRLVGHYRVNGNVDQVINANVHRSSRIKGVADCAAIGDGPGVRCMIDVTWQRIFLEPLPGDKGGSDSTFANKFTLHPSIFLFGLHPEAAEIRVLEVDDHSIAVEATGVGLEDNTLEYRTICPAIDYPGYCRHVRVTAKPGSDVVSMEIEVFGSPRFNLLLHREAVDQVDVAFK